MTIKRCVNCFYRKEYKSFNFSSMGCKHPKIEKDLPNQYEDLPDNFGCIHWKDNR